MAHSCGWIVQYPWGELETKQVPQSAGTQVGAGTAALHRSKVTDDRVIGDSLRSLCSTEFILACFFSNGEEK